MINYKYIPNFRYYKRHFNYEKKDKNETSNKINKCFGLRERKIGLTHDFYR